MGLYEKKVRPWLTRTVGGPTYADEAAWVMRHFLPVDGPLLEHACGSGLHARLLETNWPGRVTALDIDADVLKRAEADPRNAGIRFIQGDAQALPFDDTSLAGVNLFGGLFLFPDPKAAIAEVGRCLKPGAPFTGLTTRRKRGLAATALQTTAKRAFSMHFIEDHDLIAWIEGAGLAVVEIEHRGWMALFAARKPS